MPIHLNIWISTQHARSLPFLPTSFFQALSDLKMSIPIRTRPKKAEQSRMPNVEETSSNLSVQPHHKRVRFQSNPQPASPSLLSFSTLAIKDTSSAPTNDVAPTDEADSRPFNIFTALLKQPEVLLEMTKHLTVNELVSLYAISRDFHYLVNQRATSFMYAQARCRANESSQVFYHHCYHGVCMRDPGRRTLNFSLFDEGRKDEHGKPREPDPRDNMLRLVPSFRWLRMLCFREATVDDIFRSLLREGLRLPKETSLALKKFWFMMDIKTNHVRLGLITNKTFWPERDLFLMVFFLVKLDMRLNHPRKGWGETRMRTMLINQRSLSILAAVLRRDEMTTQLEMIQMIVEYNHRPSRRLRPNDSMFGVPASRVGSISREGWGRGRDVFLPLDRLVKSEAIRRGMNLQAYYVDMILYGFIDKTTYTDMRIPDMDDPEWDLEMVLKVVNGEDVDEEKEGYVPAQKESEYMNLQRRIVDESLGDFEWDDVYLYGQDIDWTKIDFRSDEDGWTGIP